MRCKERLDIFGKKFQISWRTAAYVRLHPVYSQLTDQISSSVNTQLPSFYRYYRWWTGCKLFWMGNWKKTSLSPPSALWETHFQDEVLWGEGCVCRQKKSFGYGFALNLILLGIYKNSKLSFVLKASPPRFAAHLYGPDRKRPRDGCYQDSTAFPYRKV